MNRFLSSPAPGVSCRWPTSWRALSLAMACSLAACATQEDLQPVQRRIDTGLMGLADPAASAASALAPANAPSARPRGWTGGGEPPPDALVARALQDHPSLQVAASRLRRAEAGQTMADAQSTPQLQAKAEVDRQHFSDHGLYPPPIAGASITSGTLQLEGSWEWDLFGKHRAQLESAVGQTRAAQADVQAARWWLSTQVVRTYVQLGRLQAQREVAQRTLAQRDETLQIVRQRVQQGLDTRVELKQSEGGLPDARNQIEALDEQVTLTRHALAVLSGQSPTALDGLNVQLDALKRPATPVQLPVDLLAHRPDVMAALWRAQAATQDSKATRVALFYPNIDLTTYGGYNAIGLDRLLKASSLQWGLMPAVHLPLFDGDRRRAGMLEQVAQEDLAIANYNQVLLQAAQEAADQFSSVQAVARQQASQQEAQASAEAAHGLARSRYQAGLGNYLIVLSAEAAVLAQRRAAVDLQYRVLDAQIGLIRATAGASAGSAAAPTAAASGVPISPLAASPKGQS
jgi:NodT family efflux transporter outer membrane factor (OMF) lipoprotein